MFLFETVTAFQNDLDSRVCDDSAARESRSLSAIPFLRMSVHVKQSRGMGQGLGSESATSCWGVEHLTNGSLDHTARMGCLHPITSQPASVRHQGITRQQELEW